MYENIAKHMKITRSLHIFIKDNVYHAVIERYDESVYYEHKGKSISDALDNLEASLRYIEVKE